MSLRRFTFIACIGFLALVISVLFSISQRVQNVEDRLEKVQSNMLHEQEKIRVLQAEWQYLTRPSRLEKLAQTYTLLRMKDGGEKIALTKVPMRPAPAAADQDVENSDSAPTLASSPLDIQDLHPDVLSTAANVRVTTPPKPRYKPGKTGLTLKQVSWRAR